VGPGDLWYKDAVIYSLNVETFQDSAGDGIGDFPGLTSRLDYLHGLGVTCIWLGPFYPSPGRDNRYDVADYYGVDPRLGSLGDFVDFLRVARERGMRVLIDLVVNHTSDAHPWFRAARASATSPYRDFYIWADAPPADAREGMIFPGVETSTWTFDDDAGAYYYHRFYRHQPDLNLANPRVREEIRKIIGFWLELGVSGFRIDAAPFLIERKGLAARGLNQPRPHTFFRYMRGFLSWRRGDAALLAEANVPVDEIDEYVGEGDKVHMLFGFGVNQGLWASVATEDRTPLAEAIDAAARLPAVCQWANFIRNHDELDLSGLSAQLRDAVYAAFAPDETMRLYGRGIRRRTAPMLAGDRARRELVHSLMLSISGTPVLYYGDEIGMGEDLELPERESVRTPMQWSADGGGFSSAAHESLVRPLVLSGPFACGVSNVDSQQLDPRSFLNWLKRAIAVRKTCRELSWGRSRSVATDRAHVLATVCRWEHSAFVALHNLSPHSTVATVTDSAAGAWKELTPIEVFADREYAPWTAMSAAVNIEAHGYRWFRFVAAPGCGAR
jgi:maltose alpha-D-glucosyltransferase/alpha-amylase